MAPIPRLKPYEGPALFSYGFRPFFLLGSIQAGLAVLAWVPIFRGELALASAFAPQDWHVHEMLFGFLPAVITGFLLTAIPNWTGRMPLQGVPLMVLVAAWVAGRIAVTFSAHIGAWPAMAIDLAFLALVAAAAGREIVAGRNWRNLKVLAVLGLLLVANGIFHVEAMTGSHGEYGIRLGFAATIFLLMLIGGRIVPSFTRNWLARENPGRLPIPFGRFDVVTLVVSGLALVVWVAMPEGIVTALLMGLAGFAQAARLVRWAGERTWRDRLVLILHLAYAFIPLGFWLLALSAVGYVDDAAGFHAWAGGAIGAMTLAVMSRASLGHTGRALVASRAVQVIYALVIASALLRVCASLHPDWHAALIPLAGGAWAAAFLGFAVAYWRIFTGPRYVAG
jgi:uncharacterized protein involved in response to NO